MCTLLRNEPQWNYSQRTYAGNKKLQQQTLLPSSLCSRHFLLELYARREKYRPAPRSPLCLRQLLKGKLFLRFRQVLLTGKGSASQIRKLFPAKKNLACVRSVVPAVHSCHAEAGNFCLSLDMRNKCIALQPTHTNRPTTQQSSIHPSLSIFRSHAPLYFCLKAPKYQIHISNWQCIICLHVKNRNRISNWRAARPCRYPHTCICINANVRHESSLFPSKVGERCAKLH